MNKLVREPLAKKRASNASRGIGERTAAHGFRRAFVEQFRHGLIRSPYGFDGGHGLYRPGGNFLDRDLWTISLRRRFFKGLPVVSIGRYRPGNLPQRIAVFRDADPMPSKWWFVRTSMPSSVARWRSFLNPVSDK